jgi:hypothetical protein
MKIAEVITDVQEGNYNALTAYTELKKLEAEVKNALEIIQPLAISESQKYAEKEFEYNGCKILKRSTPTTYSFDHIDAFKETSKRLEQIKKLAKLGGIDPETGEVMRAEISKHSTETIHIQILIK